MNIYIEKSRLTQFNGIIEFNDHKILSSYEIQVINGRIVSNADMFIIGSHQEYEKLARFGTEILNKVIYTKQQPKSANIACINEFAANHPVTFNNLYKTLSVTKPAPDFDPSQYIFNGLKYFVKLEYGARSINTFIVDNTLCPVSTVLSKLRQAKGQSADEFRKTLDLIKSQPGVKYIKGNTREVDEELNYSEMEYYAHEAMENVKREYRIIYSKYGCKIWAFERERNSDNTGIVDNEFQYVKSVMLSTKIIDFIEELMTGLDSFAGSIDLLVDENDQITIVETSNQYGMSDIRPDVKERILLTTIQDAIDQAM